MENADNRKLMTVRKMGDLLGLKKTERYYLVKKGFFEVIQVNGQMWVVCDSFEKWYVNQAKYKKVTGEEPGRELKEWSYSPREIAQLLEIDEATVYEILKDNQIETVTVDYWKRVPKEAFEKWYSSQKRYRTKQDREKDAKIEEATVSMPEMARLLGVEREIVYRLLQSKTYKDVFEIVVVAERRRITKRSLEKFLTMQDKYRLIEDNDLDHRGISCGNTVGSFWGKHFRGDRRTVDKTGGLLTQTEAAELAGVSRTTIMRWVEKGYFHEIVVGTAVRIPREPFEKWLRQQKTEED